MRVLMISDYADPTAKVGTKRFGGISVYIKNLSHHLSKNGVKVDVFTPLQGQTGKQVLEVNSNLRFIRIPTGPQNTFKQEVLDFINDEKTQYDIIHSNYWFAGIATIEISKELKLPQVHIFHSNGKIRLGFLKEAGLDKTDPIIKTRINSETQIAKLVKNIIAASSIEKSTLFKTYGIQKNNIEIIPIGVDTKIFKPISQKTARKKLRLQSDSKVIVFVSRIEENKGATTLIMAMPSVIQNYPNTKLLIVGGDKTQNVKGSEIYELKKLAKELKVDKNITFAGRVDQKDLYVYYSAADICTVPSYYETFGIVPLESMACATPVVASKTGGLTFTVKNEIAGYLARPRDHRDLGEKIKLTLSKGKSYFSARCTTIIRENFMWENIAREYVNYYEQAIFNFQSADSKWFMKSNTQMAVIPQVKTVKPLKRIIAN